MGPGCSILLEKPLDSLQVEFLKVYVTDIGDNFKGFEKDEVNGFRSWNYSVKLSKIIQREEIHKGCVFSMHIWNGLITEVHGSYKIEEDVLMQLQKQIGFRPYGHIQLDAACNGDIDHVLLGHMAFYLLENLGGYIDFGGVIFDRKDNPIYKGKLVDIWYQTTQGKYYYYQIADKDFLKNCIMDDNFRLLK